MTLPPAGVAAEGSVIGHLRRGARLRVARSASRVESVGEDVLDAPVVDLEPHQAQPEVTGGVADQVAHGIRAVGRRRR